ncbi:MAG: T9SS type A sorting domain-containing protein [Ignavibacteria bacterium]|nr:T9SS type A sorting domain-containing protein [Ignavibacteria bacterium]
MLKKIIVCLFITSSIFTFQLNLYSQTSICKTFFCNCCHSSGNGAYYDVYDFNTDTLIGNFFMDASGCNLDNPINVVSGQVCYITTSCHGSSLATIVYFTGCVCQDGADTVKLPCCPRNDDEDGQKGIKGSEIEAGSFVLRQNYPNPFNPNTHILFELPVESFVKLSIFDSKGSLVKQLINKTLRAGYHDVMWRAEDASSGIYFYKLEAGNFTDQKKMVLIK